MPSYCEYQMMRRIQAFLHHRRCCATLKSHSKKWVLAMMIMVDVWYWDNFTMLPSLFPISVPVLMNSRLRSLRRYITLMDPGAANGSLSDALSSSSCTSSKIWKRCSWCAVSCDRLMTSATVFPSRTGSTIFSKKLRRVVLAPRNVTALIWTPEAAVACN